METNFSKVFALCRMYTTQSQFHLFFVLLGFIYNIYIRFQKHWKLKKISGIHTHIYIYIYICLSLPRQKVSVLDEKTNDVHISWMSSNCNVLENRYITYRNFHPFTQADYPQFLQWWEKNFNRLPTLVDNPHPKIKENLKLKQSS